ncbi:MAG: type II secretion system F family protein [Myxococcota bacterium]
MDFELVVYIVFTLVVVAAVIGYGFYAAINAGETPDERLTRMFESYESMSGGDLMGSDDAAVSQLAARLGKLAQGGEQAADVNEEYRKMLKHAGYKNRRAVDIFNGVRIAALAGGPLAVSPMALFLETQVVAFAMIIAAAAGYYMPILILRSQAQDRQTVLLRAYPDALDLLVSSVESGLGLDQAFRRVATEMQTINAVVAREFALVNAEVGAGIERIKALKHLEERTGLEEVRSLVNMLAQAERFGSSVADSLRMYSGVAREKRMARAEEAAGQIGSKLTFIMIIFFLPVLMAVLLTPSIIRIALDAGAES